MARDGDLDAVAVVGGQAIVYDGASRGDVAPELFAIAEALRC